jgi:hypothetical protein
VVAFGLDGGALKFDNLGSPRRLRRAMLFF